MKYLFSNSKVGSIMNSSDMMAMNVVALAMRSRGESIEKKTTNSSCRTNKQTIQKINPQKSFRYQKPDSCDISDSMLENFHAKWKKIPLSFNAGIEESCRLS